MGKTSEKPAAGETKKRSRLMLALLATAPLVLAGGGYAGWALFLSAPDAEAAQAEAGHGEADHAEAAGEHGEDAHGAPDQIKVSALPRDIAAESSFTHSYALSVLIRQKCGETIVKSLHEASNAEAQVDGLLAQLSWEAAARRAAQLKEKSCGHLFAEIHDAEDKAADHLGKSLAEKEVPSGGH